MGKYLSVDCGGTKTAFLLCDEEGRALASCVKGPGNYMVSGTEAVLAVLREGVLTVCEEAGIGKDEIAGSFLALAALGDIPEDVPRIQKLVEEALAPIPVVLGNDTENALSGSLLGESGIHVIAGTGSIGLGIDGDGQYIRSGGWHHLFGGDEGSGYWIGARLVQHFTKQADGREKRTELYSYLMEKYELGCAENILELVINKWNGDRDKLASMSKDASELARRGDACVLEIFAEAGRELALIARSIYERGSFAGTVPVSYSGGVFKSIEYLRGSMEEALSDIPHRLVEPALLPVSGGILLAMKSAGKGVNEAVVENLKDFEKEAL